MLRLNVPVNNFSVMSGRIGIKGQYDLTFDLKINVGLCDLYFMIQ